MKGNENQLTLLGAKEGMGISKARVRPAMTTKNDWEKGSQSEAGRKLPHLRWGEEQRASGIEGNSPSDIVGLQ